MPQVLLDLLETALKAIEGLDDQAGGHERGVNMTQQALMRMLGRG